MKKVVFLTVAALFYACGPSDGTSDSSSPADLPDITGDRIPDDFTPVGEVDCCPDIEADGEHDPDSEADVKTGPAEFESLSIAPTKRLQAVWGEDGILVSVGQDGTVIRRQGGYWSPMKTPTAEDLLCVFGLATDDVYAGGEDGMLIHFDGKEWEKIDTGLGPFGDIAFRGAWGEGEDFYFVGDKGTILHYFAGNWKKGDSLSSYNLHGIWGVSLSDIYVAAAGGAVLRKMGGAWSSQQVTQGSTILHAVFGFSSKDLWGGGTKGEVVVHDASGWSPKLSNDAYARALHGVWAFSEKDVWLVGVEGALIHSEGSKWMTTDIAGPYYGNHSFYGIWGQSGETNQAWAVGEKGAILHYDGVEWKDEPSAPIVDINDIAGTGWEDVVAVGGDGLVLQFDGEMWTGPDRVVEADLNAVTYFDGATWAVGTAGTIVRMKDGVGTAVEAGVETTLLGACSGASTLAAIGEQGKMYMSVDGEIWTAVSTGVFDSLRDCHIDPSGKVTVVGDLGKIIEVVGGEASQVSIATIANLNRIAWDGNESLYAVGDNGLILRNSGSGWEKVHEEPGLFLYGVHAFGDRIVTVGWAGRLLVYDPASGDIEHIVTPDPGVLLQVWGSDHDHLFVVGKKGKMLRYVDEE